MTNYREILRLHSLGLNKTEIASSCRCARNTVAATLQQAANCGLQWPLPEEMSDMQLSERLFPSSTSKPVYKMPDYASVHKELQRSGVTLNLLWLEYCNQCRAAGEIPYQSTQFNKYYADHLAKVNATIHLNHKPGEVMQVDWAGKVGSNTQVAVQAILSGYKVEQQGYKSCMGLLKLADKYTPERLENACKRAFEYTPRPSLKNIQAILASGQDKAIPEQSTATASSSRYGFTRGAAYYGRGNK